MVCRATTAASSFWFTPFMEMSGDWSKSARPSRRVRNFDATNILSNFTHNVFLLYGSYLPCDRNTNHPSEWRQNTMKHKFSEGEPYLVPESRGPTQEFCLRDRFGKSNCWLEILGDN